MQWVQCGLKSSASLIPPRASVELEAISRGTAPVLVNTIELGEVRL